MNIYIACHDQKLAREVAAALQAAGYGITSRWLTKPFGPADTFDEETRAVFACENYIDVDAADALVLVAGPERYSGGKFMEAGYAYAKNKDIVILGRRENVQCYGPGIRSVETHEQLVAALNSPSWRSKPSALSGLPDPVFPGIYVSPLNEP